MATNPSTDLTEEDAADLQFPKENIYASSLSNTSNSSNDTEQSVNVCDVCLNYNRLCSCNKCAKCAKSLRVPYIECTQCDNINLCCKCFANGSEIGAHESNHSYRVLKSDFVLFPNSNWTADEEQTMLDVLYTYGYGNWELISNKLTNRSRDEIKRHYDHFYLNNPCNSLPVVQETASNLFPKAFVPFRLRLTECEEPPRYASGTLAYETVSGYNAARSDFETEYDAHAEQLLGVLRDSNCQDNVVSELMCGIVRSYNRRLRERERRKLIVREHGLILMRKTMSWMHRYDKTLTRNLTERLLCFMQFFSGIEFDYFMEGLHRAAELRSRIMCLSEYRRKGIRTLEAAEIYDVVKEEEEQQARELDLFVSNPQYNWKKLKGPATLCIQSTHNQPNRRGVSRPLDIIGLPGYDKLSESERELCINARFVPFTYFELKDSLIAENKKLGYVKLQVARRLLKIDVNKTRKLYDFLVKEGYISRPHR